LTYSHDDGIVVACPARPSPSTPAGHAAIRGCAVQEEESKMPRQSIDSRVETLEARVAMLEELPARMDRLESQIVQLREENAAEHSAMRQEIAGLAEEMRRLHDEQGRHMRVLHEDLVSRIAAMNDARPAPPPSS
jgi:outer membrane murein-binding lipoprotein Lpp